jgi:hypothetical protein
VQPAAASRRLFRFRRVKFSICYIDEAGCPGVLSTAYSDVQPALVISALIVDAEKLKALTNEFIKLKVRFFPGKFSSLRHDLDALMIEMKGSDVRRGLRHGDKHRVQHHQKFLDDLFSLLETTDTHLLSRIWIKGVGQPFDGRAVYTTTTQRIAKLFQHYLEANRACGVVIGDFRDTRRNSHISHSVFTQKHKRGDGGDAYPNLIEAPTFGISDNHAGLQIVDLITSAVIYPIATNLYCSGFVHNVHVNAADSRIHVRYRSRLKRLQYAPRIDGSIQHGITVNDPHANRTSYEIFR